MSTPKLKKDVLKILVEKPLTLKELAAKMGLKEKKVFNLIKSLFGASEITSMKTEEGKRRYRLLTDEEKAARVRAAEYGTSKEDAGEDEEEDEEEDK